MAILLKSEMIVSLNYVTQKYRIMEVKERLINQIGEISDEALLFELEIIVNDLTRIHTTPYMLDDAMIASAEKSEKEFEEGKMIDHQHAMKTIKEWLKER